MKYMFIFASGLLIGIITTMVVATSYFDSEWTKGYQAAQEQIRLQLEKGHQGEYAFYLSEWGDIKFHPRGNRDGINYEFKE
ncbi:MAG: hypothetical protein ACLFP2_06190 [Candidatus Woesearchaeota archaeon]